MQPITAWAGLIAEAQATPRFAQPRRQLRQNLGTVLENPELADLAAAATLRNRHSDRRLVHIQPDISHSIHQARLPCMRLCAGHPAQPSTFCMPKGGPPITQRTSGLIDAETDAHLWAEQFDRDTDDLFALQNEITSRIASALSVELIA